jgi:tryptophanase
MGGLIGVKDPDSPRILEIKANCIEFEGFYTYGGLNGRDMEVLAIGMLEGINEDYLKYRIGQMEYRLLNWTMQVSLIKRRWEATEFFSMPVRCFRIFHMTSSPAGPCDRAV